MCTNTRVGLIATITAIVAFILGMHIGRIYAPRQPPISEIVIRDSLIYRIDTVQLQRERLKYIYVKQVEQFNSISLDSNIVLFEQYCQRYIDSNRP